MSARLTATTDIILELCENAIRDEGRGDCEKKRTVAKHMYEDIANPYTMRNLLVAHRLREAALLEKLKGVMVEFAQVMANTGGNESSRNDKWKQAVAIAGDDYPE